jgi:hypothetical protein
VKSFNVKFGCLIEWDQRPAMDVGTTGRLERNGVAVEFEQHMRRSDWPAHNSHFSTGETWYIVGAKRYETIEAIVDDLLPK